MHHNTTQYVELTTFLCQHSDMETGEVAFEAAHKAARALVRQKAAELQDLDAHREKVVAEYEQATQLLAMLARQLGRGESASPSDRLKLENPPRLVPARDRELARRRLRDERQHQAHFVAEARHFTSTPREGSSTIRAAEIVNEREYPISNADLYQEFAHRRWIEDDWSNPEAAVSQAARRAEQAGMITKIGRFWAPLSLPSDFRFPHEAAKDSSGGDA